MQRLYYLLLFFLTALPASYANAEKVAPVTVASPTLSNISDTLRLTGSLSAEKHSQLAPRVEGLVAAIFVDAGSYVNKGDTLLKLDTEMIQHQLKLDKAKVDQAQAEKAEAQRLVKEAENLRKQRHIPQSELDNRRSQLQIKIAELAQAEASKNNTTELIKRHTLIAPFSGVISHKNTELGQWANKDNNVFGLVDLSKVRLDVYVPQEMYSAINPHSKIRVQPDAYPGLTLTGQIESIVPVSDSEARSFLVRITIEKQNLVLLPGTSATVKFYLNNAQQQLFIPHDALLLHPDGGASVFVIRQNTAHRQTVKIGKSVEQGVHIINGLEPTDQIVIRGNEVLRDQQTVQINNKN
jgi:RND family efflux transporter MFP subunit